MVVHTCNPSNVGGRYRRIVAGGQPRKVSEILCEKNKLAMMVHAYNFS
jgi:hypothetical protein